MLAPRAMSLGLRSMKAVDEQRLESDLQYRYDYLAEFIGFDSEDVALIQASAPHLGPKIPQLVERTYQRLLSYDATARHFVPRQHGHEGEVPSTVEALNADHPQIQFRKDHLNRYFVQLIGRAYDHKMVQYLDMVGKIHTTHAGNKQIDVPLVQMNGLIGLLSDILLDVISEWPLDQSVALRTARAFNKLLWIQNDFINRHYVSPAVE